jgi:hypothetical protein
MTREQLTAILTATRTDALHTATGAYLDWSGATDDRGRLVLEIGAEATDPDDTTITLRLERAEVEALVHRLAATLLAS